MTPRKASRKLTAAKRRELEVAAAVAREAVLQLHVARAVKMIDLAGDRVSALRMVNIYLRLQALTGPEGSIVANRVLALLGQRGHKGPTTTLFIEGEVDQQVEEPRSVFRIVRDRLRGRVHHELRRWVELHSGATQVALLDIHVRHALRFVKELADTHAISDAVELYSELTGVAPAVEDALYAFVLDRLAAEELPRSAKGKRPEEEEEEPSMARPKSKRAAASDEVTLYAQPGTRPKRAV
jgi:hypothetical protein